MDSFSANGHRRTAYRDSVTLNHAMKKWIFCSLLLNIVVLIPVCAGLLTDANWVHRAYGEATPARGILLSVYISILLASFLLIVFREPKPVATLLIIQIVYKLTTPFSVGTLQNPVVISNLGIAAFHLVTLWMIWRTMGNPLRG
jgi:hypothetical protein